RRILYTANNFPNFISLDSYMNYPHGWEVLWPPLFDQICAAFSLILGQDTKPGVEMAASIVPVLIGTIATIAVYYLVKEIFDHKVAIFASFMAILAPTYLQYTKFAAIDHHSLEVLFLLGAFLFLILALCRNNKWYIFAALAGVSIAGLAYTWYGSILYVAIIPLYALIQMTLDLKEKRSSRDISMTLGLALAVALILVLPYWSASWLLPSAIGIMAAFVVICFMFAVSHLMAKRNIRWQFFPLNTIFQALAFILIIWLSGRLLEFSDAIQNGLEYIWGGWMIGKISEAEPLIYNALTLYQVALSKMGLNLLYSFVGLGVLLSTFKRSEGRRRQGLLLLLVLSASAIILSFGQIRFLYLSTVTMGIMISILFFFILNLLNDWLRERNQKMTLIPIFALFLALTMPTISEVVHIVASDIPIDVEGDWQESIVWLKDNSNATSFYDSPEKTPEYSVMCWWDYGNWIMYLGERPVVANNFQTGWEDAAKFYLSEKEEDATALMDARGSRYVFVDYSMAYGKLGAITNWANENLLTYFRAEDAGSQIKVYPTERLFNTTLGKLYYFDGAETGHFRLIHESKTFIGENPPKSYVKVFEYVPGALIRIRSGPDQNVGAILNMTSNQDRAFIYANEAVKRDGVFEVSVPYSTESRYDCHAISPYLIYSGNANGVKMQNLSVSEDDIINGRTIDIAF
ncbi:MAG: STT3 domain-containing protein, partial [Methanothrix sp.]